MPFRWFLLEKTPSDAARLTGCNFVGDATVGDSPAALQPSVGTQLEGEPVAVQTRGGPRSIARTAYSQSRGSSRRHPFSEWKLVEPAPSPNLVRHGRRERARCLLFVDTHDSTSQQCA